MISGKMKNMRNTIILAWICVLGLSCTENPTGTLTANLTASSNANLIDRYIFMVEEDSSDPNRVQVLYPSDCFDFANACVKLSSCGFAADATSLDVQINFGDFPANSSINLIVCGVEDSTIIASGLGNITNTGGQTVNVTMAEDATACLSLPAACL